MKKNKKGFTLIELLAVIIILGVLMIIAIPSVTEYISSSRKKAYIDTAKQYISTVMTKVNQADDLKFFDEDTLYLVKVGHEKACVSLEKGGQSPFNDTWKYAYVGVTYNGSGYTYYYMSEDSSGQGIAFTEQSNLKDDDYDELVVTSTPNYSNKLYANAGPVLYRLGKVNDTTTINTVTTDEDGNEVLTEVSDTKFAEIANIVPTTTTGEGEGAVTTFNFNNIVIVDPDANGVCEYEG